MKYTIVLLFIVTCSLAQAQIGTDFHKELQFGKYLVGSKQSDDALFLFKKLEKLSLSPQERDTLNFVIGKLHFHAKDLIGASIYLSKVSTTSRSYYIEAQLFNAFSHTYLHEFKEAEHTLKLINPSTPLIDEVVNLEISGLALLKRDFSLFDERKKKFTQSFFQVSKQQASLIDLAQDLKAHKYKSPFVAGLMSAVIPGTGKMYSGKPGQGIIGLLTTGILGLQALEGYRKDGASSFRFIAFSTLFSFFYIGNIWGSVFTAKTSNDEFNEAVDHRILLDLHIPLRTIFN